VVAERIHDPPETPPVGVNDRYNLRGAGYDGLLAHRSRVFNDEQHPNGTAA